MRLRYVRAGGGLPHMLPARPTHREFEARGLLHSSSGYGAELMGARQGRGYAPPPVQTAPLQPVFRPASAAAQAAYTSSFQRPASLAAPTYTAIPAPAHAISRLVEPDIEAQCGALGGSGPDAVPREEQYGVDTGSTASTSDEPAAVLPVLGKGQLTGATSASQLWQLDAQHSRFAALEQVGYQEGETHTRGQAAPPTAQLPLPDMDSKDASRHSSGVEVAAEQGKAAEEALQVMQAGQEPSRQQVTMWGNPLATVRMPQGAPGQAPTCSTPLNGALLFRWPGDVHCTAKFLQPR